MYQFVFWYSWKECFASSSEECITAPRGYRYYGYGEGVLGFKLNYLNPNQNSLLCGQWGGKLDVLDIPSINKGKRMWVALTAHSVDILLSLNSPATTILSPCRKVVPSGACPTVWLQTCPTWASSLPSAPVHNCNYLIYRLRTGIMVVWF